MRFSAAFFRPARRPALAGLIGTLAMIAVPASALAQSCPAVRSELQTLHADAMALMNDNPGSMTVFATCLGAGFDTAMRTESDAEGLKTLGACAAGACLLTTGYWNCVEVNTRLFVFALRATSLETRLDSCTP